MTNKVVYLAMKAGELIITVYNDPTNMAVSYKDDKSPLTQADLLANDYLVKHLKSVYECPIISEESKKVPYEERKDYTYYWLVDPLDGTKEFVKRNGQFTVNVALMERSVSGCVSPILGVVYVPVSGESYYAYKSGGAWYLTDKTAKRIHISDTYAHKSPLRVVCSNSHTSKGTSNFISCLNSKTELTEVRIGSSLKFMRVAEGKADIYPRLTPCMEWDTAASHIIVNEAGGQIEEISPEGNLMDKTLDYNKESLLSPFFVVWGSKLIKKDFFIVN